MRKILPIINLSILIIIFFVGCYYIFIQNTQKEVYINTLEIFDDFELKKELEKKYNDVEIARASILDSIKMTIGVLNSKVAEGGEQVAKELERVTNLFFKKQKEFEEDNLALTTKYNKQIWTQLNQYFMEYGIENNYKFILGATGNGNLIYADSTLDKTKDVLLFVNKKYFGE